MQRMTGKLSALIASRRGTFLLLSLFFVGVITVLIIGLNNIPGLAIGYLATTALFLTVARKWRRIRSFVILFFASFLAIFILSFLYVEVIYRLAVAIGGIPTLESTWLSIVHLVISDFILLACPTGMLMGIVGVITLITYRLVAAGSKNGTIGNT